MPIVRVQCVTYSDDDPAGAFGEVREFITVPRPGDFVALGGVIHAVTARVIHPADRDTEITVELYTRELDQDEYREAVRHPDRPSRLAPEELTKVTDEPAVKARQPPPQTPAIGRSGSSSQGRA